MHLRRWIGLAVLLLVPCGGLSCSGGEAARERPPVLLLAVDGMEWNVLLPLVQAGEVPTIRGLMERGVFGHLKTVEPTVSPAIWTTIATGKPIALHGIKGFTHRGERGLELYTSADRQVKALWNLLTDAGRESAWFGWWITWPAETIDGLMVAQTNLPVRKGADETKRFKKGGLIADAPGQVYPPAAEARVMRTLDTVEGDLDGILEREYGLHAGELPEPEARLVEETRWSLRADETYLRLALDRLSQGAAPELTVVYTGGTDVVGHRFWRYAYPWQFRTPVAADRVALFGDLLAATYRRVDHALARLLERMPADTTVVIVSDHGMQAGQTQAAFKADADIASLLSGYHLKGQPGVVIAAGPRIRAPRTPPDFDGLRAARIPVVASVFDVAPTLLALLDVPAGKDMQGRVHEDWLEPSWLAEHPPTRVLTHESEAWRQDRARLLRSSAELEQRLDQLRALGYIGRDD